MTPDGTPDVTREAGRTRWWMLPVALGATLAVLWPALRGELVYDDLLIVARNPTIRSFANLPAMFSNAYWDFLDPREASRIGYWRPLTAMLLTLGHALGGGRPWAFHALCLALHLAATAVAFRLVRRLAGSATTAFWCALLFGLHPVHVESVAWISAANDPLFGLLALLSLDAFLRWRDRECRDPGSGGLPLAAAAFLALALLAKELAASVIPLAMALDLGRALQRGDGRERLRSAARAYGPLLAVLGLYWLVRVFVFGDLRAGFDRTTTDFGVGLARLALLRVEILGGGLALLAWPEHLSLFHLFRPVLPLGDPELLAALGALLAACVLAALLARRRAGLALAALLIVPAALAPVLLRAQNLGQFPLSERFLYVPVLGFALLAVLAARRWLPAPVAALALGAVAVGYGLRSHARLAVWRDETALFEAAEREAPRSPYVHWGLGRVLIERYQKEGLPRGDATLLERALEEFTLAQDLTIEARQGAGDVFATLDDRLQSNVGVAWCHLFAAEAEGSEGYGDYGVAERAFALILEAFPTSVEALTGRGVALWKMGRDAEAREVLERAVRLDDRSVVAHASLARIHQAAGRLPQARYHLERVLAIWERSPKHLLELARLEFADGQLERARELAERAARIAPGDPAPPTLLARIAAHQGDWSTAQARLDEALAIDPGDGDANLQRGKVLVATGSRDLAITAFRRACDRLPTSFEAHYNLGALLLESGAVDAAVPYLERAYQVGSSGPAMSALRGSLAQARPDDPDFAVALATLDHGRGSDVAARFWLDVALAADPDHAPALHLEARLFRESGQLERAADSLRRAVAARPDSFAIRDELGGVLDELGLREEALEQMHRALELGPLEGWDEELRATVVRRIERRIAELEAEVGPSPGPGG